MGELVTSLSFLWPLTQTLRAKSGPGLAVPPPSLLRAPTPAGAGQRGDLERQRRRERLEETTEALESGDLRGAGGPKVPPAGQGGQRPLPGPQPATSLLKDADMPLGVCGAGSGHFALDASQGCPKEPQLHPCVARAVEPLPTSSCLPPHRRGSQGQGREGQRQASLTLSRVRCPQSGTSWPLWPCHTDFQTLREGFAARCLSLPHWSVRCHQVAVMGHVWPLPDNNALMV